MIVSIYRHPHNNFKNFIQYLSSKKTKNCLLNIFFNLLCSYGFVPHILQPTRVIDNTATIIDNIFRNNIQHNISCANILLTLSEHFSQYLSVKSEKVDLKEVNMYQQDYSTFSSESCCEDISIQNWNYSPDNVHDTFNDFYNKLEGSVNRHALIKKLPHKEIKLTLVKYRYSKID